MNREELAQKIMFLVNETIDEEAEKAYLDHIDKHGNH